MANSVNKATLVGRVGKDPEIRSTQGGMRIANLSIATSETWHDKNSGEKKEKTEWHRVSVFNDGLVKIIEKYVKKGALLYIEGKIETRKWQDKQGNDRYSTEINLGAFGGRLDILVFAKDSDEEGGAPPRGNTSGRQPPAGKSEGDWSGPGSDMDSEIPF